MLRCALTLLFLGLTWPGLIHAQSAPLRSLKAQPATGSAQATIVANGPLWHTAQLLPLDKDGQLVGKGKPAQQVEQLLVNLAAVGARFERLVKVNVYVTRPETVTVVQGLFAKKFTGATRPAVSFVAGALPHPDALVALDAVALADPEAGDKVKRTTQAALLPAGVRVYVSGQAEKGSDLASATRQTLESLRATLKHLGLTDADVVQVKAFLNPPSGVADVQREIAKFYGDQTPPVVFVEWISSLPIEIELIAHGGKERAGETIEYLTPPGVKASPVYSRVVRINRGPSIYVSGLYGTQAKGSAEEIREIFARLDDLLQEAGSDFEHLAKATYYVSTEEASKKLNELRPNWYDPQRPPSASKALVPGVGMAGRSITLDMIAVPVPEKAK